MTMTLQATVRTAFGTIRTFASNAVVTVSSGSQSAQAIRDSVDVDSDLSGNGEEGLTTGRVFLDASEFDRPARGAVITVDGNKVFVTRTDLDPVGAVLTIEYQNTRPVEGL